MLGWLYQALKGVAACSYKNLEIVTL